MLFVLSWILSRSNCILILIMSDLAISAPFRSRKRSPNEQGFSASPRVLEIQLPLKIASKQDLVAWSKYVMSLVASKINFVPTNLKDTLSSDKRVSFVDNSAIKSKEMTKKAPFSEKRQGFNYPARRLKGPHMSKGDEKVMAYPLSLGGMKTTTPTPQNSFNFPSSDINGPNNFANFNPNFDNLFQQSEVDTFGNFNILAQRPPAATYLPISRTFDNEFGQTLPITVNDELTATNLSRLGEPLLTFPFQAVITINSQLPATTAVLNTQPKDYFAFRRDPLHEFQQFEKDFEKNYTLTNESGQVNVVFNDLDTNEEKEQEDRQKKKNEKKTKSARKQNLNSQNNNRQPSILGDLLRMLGILKKLPKNTTEITVATPVLSILKGTNSQKIQVTFDDEIPPNQERQNETNNQAQELNDDDDDDDEDEDEEEGGSIQALIDLLPLAAPLLEDLSDPESDTNVIEVLQAAIPLLEELSDPEQDGIDIPAVFLPLSQKLSEGPEGEGSDSGAILGPLITLIAPLIGPLLGPLIGPLSRASSGPGGKQGSASLITAIAGPLSEPQGPYGQSVLSNLIATITAKLSKELAASADESDVKSLVSSLVSGVLAGASAGSSGQKSHRGHKDTYYAPTTYGSYGNTYDSYQPMPNGGGGGGGGGGGNEINDILKEVLGAFLKLSATSSTSSANLSGTSSSGSAGLSASSSEGSSKEPPQTPAYGPPTNAPYEQPPPSMRPPAYNPPASSPYETFTRRRTGQQIRKKF
ncbi:uncharacterized protein [Anoplolepis gracilipes]|uniref:uncharacterized protein n=1 Tax=Anoplolepis gracilipes TaxID=354296 RepID=UPI003BA3D6F9